jgi:hypothetical protein
VQKDENSGKFIGKNINIYTKESEWKEEINGDINGAKNISPVKNASATCGSILFKKLANPF